MLKFVNKLILKLLSLSDTEEIIVCLK